MHRTQIHLEEWQRRALRALSRRERRSVAAIVREAVSEYLGGRSRRALGRIAAIQGIAEGPRSLGRDHDRHLYGRKSR